MMTQTDRLVVLWGEPEAGRRHVIGDLWRTPEGYCFAYRAPDDLVEAQRRGFTFLPEFPELRTEADPFRARYLFATFSQRIPSPKRPDFRSMLEAWGSPPPDDPLRILAASGGVLLTDRVELAEWRSIDDDLLVPLEFRLSGERHHGSGRRLVPGARVTFRREPENQYDRGATAVWVEAGDQAGYVPRQYSAMFARLLDAGVGVEGVAVRRLVLPPERDRWIIRAQRISSGG